MPEPERMSTADVYVHALGAFSAALRAPDQDSAVGAVRESLAGLTDVDELRRVATCLAVTAVWQMPARRDRVRLRRWLERFRLEVAWAAGDG